MTLEELVDLGKRTMDLFGKSDRWTPEALAKVSSLWAHIERQDAIAALNASYAEEGWQTCPSPSKILKAIPAHRSARIRREIETRGNATLGDHRHVWGILEDAPDENDPDAVPPRRLVVCAIPECRAESYRQMWTQGEWEDEQRKRREYANG